MRTLCFDHLRRIDAALPPTPNPSTLHARIGRLGCAALLALLPALAIAQNASDGCNPDVNGNVYAVATQPDGHILLGGDFSQVSAQDHLHLARLAADCSVDAGFATTAVDDRVDAFAVLADGRILIGGYFKQVGVYARSGLARLNADGSVDPTFTANVDGYVDAISLQPDGKILVGGAFTGTSNGSVHTSWANIARLNADGSSDGSFVGATNGEVFAILPLAGDLYIGGAFDQVDGQAAAHFKRLGGNGDNLYGDILGADGTVRALAAQPDGTLLIGGDFTHFTDFVYSYPYAHLVRLDQFGSVDLSFVWDPDANVDAIAVQTDGKILVAGAFAAVGDGAYTRHGIFRIGADGILDSGFNPDPDTTVLAVATQADGKLVIGGSFSQLEGGAQVRHRLARLNGDGTTERDFNPVANGLVRSAVVQPDGKLIVGGDFTTLDDGLTARNRIARFNADGSVDGSYDPNVSDYVQAMVLQPDGKLVIGGNFLLVNAGIFRNYIARLNSDGTVDPTFDPYANGPVYALALQADGKILVGGGFTALANGAATRHRIARLNSDGSVDPGFDPDADASVNAIALQPDGRIVIGGSFTTLAGGALTHHRLARLGANGSVDATFNPDADKAVLALALEPDGRIAVGGIFSTLDGGAHARHDIGRLLADGSLDGGFDPNANNAVYALAFQPDGKLMAGGTFSSLAGNAVTRYRLARLNDNGEVDDYDAGLDSTSGTAVRAIALQPDGKAVIGGLFANANGAAVARSNLARLGASAAAVQSIEAVGYANGSSIVTWRRSGSGPELAQPPQLLFSVAGNVYSVAGTMLSVAGGWRFDGSLPLPLGESFFLRVRGAIASGQDAGSSGLADTIAQFYSYQDEGIFHDGFN